MSDSQQPVPSPDARRVIKRYSNRKLYDTKGSQYVTLLQIADMVRAGEEVQIIDNSTKEDKTEVTLALIISEELKARPRGIPLATLKALIRNRGERILHTLRDGPIGRLIPKEEEGQTPRPDAPVDACTDSMAAPATQLAELPLSDISEQNSLVDGDGVVSELRGELRRLEHRLTLLEQQVARALNSGE
jgi:polyhydroxyalkanoate synthesis repressor PhaR